MGKKKRTIHSSRVPPPTWTQVFWLLGGGGGQLLVLGLMHLYQLRIDASPTVGRFDEIFGMAYSLMFFLGMIGASAVLLGLWKIVALLRMRARKKKR